MSISQAQIDAAARALHRFSAPRVGNDVEGWDELSAQGQARWLKMATLALAASLEVSREADTPVMEPKR